MSAHVTESARHTTFGVHSLDRLARNLLDLRRIVSELTDKGVAVVFVKNALTFTVSACYYRMPNAPRIASSTFAGSVQPARCAALGRPTSGVK